MTAAEPEHPPNVFYFSVSMTSAWRGAFPPGTAPDDVPRLLHRLLDPIIADLWTGLPNAGPPPRVLGVGFDFVAHYKTVKNYWSAGFALYVPPSDAPPRLDWFTDWLRAALPHPAKVRLYYRSFDPEAASRPVEYSIQS